MRLIDADKLKECDFGEYGYEMRYEIDRQPTVQAIPIDKVKQAREEINDLDIHFDNDYFSSNRDAMFKCNEVLAIMDKLIAESEDKE